MANENKKGMFSDKNSNGYILTYSTVMIVLVAAVLAFVAQSLYAPQQENVMNEKKNAILASLNSEDQSFDEFITAYTVDANGETIADFDAAKTINLLFGLEAAFAAETYPVFEAKDGRIVVPVTGAGLWGPVWGYVAFQKDMNTLSGVVFDHKGETPGLGAEIATPEFQQHFVDKTIFDEAGNFVSVKLIKGGAKDPMHEVDAITGGTKTSDGVTNMIFDSIENYLPLLESKKAPEAPVAQEPAVEEMSNPQIDQTNE